MTGRLARLEADRDDAAHALALVWVNRARFAGSTVLLVTAGADAVMDAPVADATADEVRAGIVDAAESLLASWGWTGDAPSEFLGLVRAEMGL